MARIFVSYRREDSAMATGRICDRLIQVFGRQNLFQDIDHIPLGVDFRQVMEQAIGQSAVMLAIIGPSWLTVRNAQGLRRLDDPADYVRLEVAAALQRGIPVIPVLVESAAMPKEGQLPADIKPLVYRNGIEVRSGPHFTADVTELISRLTALVGRPAAPTPSSRASQRADTTRARQTLGRMYGAGLVGLAIGVMIWLTMGAIFGADSQIQPGSKDFVPAVIGGLAMVGGAFMMFNGFVGALAMFAINRNWRWALITLVTAGLALLLFIRQPTAKR